MFCGLRRPGAEVSGAAGEQKSCTNAQRIGYHEMSREGQAATGLMYSDTATTSFRFSHRQCVALVFGCTLLGAVAQVLMKVGSAVLASADFRTIATSLALLAGYSLYGLSTVLLVLALRDGQLSVLYPVVSLTYVWVTVLSVMIFQESLNVFKVLGVATIMLGVAILGRNGKA